jgi:hypothetical protein
MNNKLQVIGRNVMVELVGHDCLLIPAKVDTGADSSSIWATNITINKAGTLSFTLFGKSSPYFTGEVIKRTAYRVALVRSSNGHGQIRYRTEIPLRIAGKRVRASLFLSDRSINHFPILLGRKTIYNKFLVDVSLKEYDRPPIMRPGVSLNKELLKDPYAFYKKYHPIERKETI